VNESRRVYLSNALLKVLGLNAGDRVSFELGRHVYIKPAGETDGKAGKIDVKQRVYVPDEVMERLNLSIGDDVMFLYNAGKVSMRRVETSIKW